LVQVAPQAPPEHVGVAPDTVVEQTWPHEPQLFRSVVASVQAVLHSL
jgi:hypothetical protein